MIDTIAPVISPGRKWATLAVTCFGLFMTLLDVTIVNVALPTIGSQLQASFAQLQWVVSAYTIPLAVLLIFAGRLGDRHGKKLWFIVGLVLFTVFSLLCGLVSQLGFSNEWRMTALIVLRACQGIGGAFMLPLALAIISTVFQGAERGIAFGIFGGVSALGTAGGPVLGGLLVHNFGWEWVFFVNVPIGIMAIVASVLILPALPCYRDKPGMDLPGILALSLSLLGVVTGLIRGQDLGWLAGESLAWYATAIVGLVSFILIERKAKNPLMDLQAFRNPSFVGANISAFTLSAGLYSLLFFLVLYIQNFLGFSAIDTGLRLLCMSGPILFAAPLAGWAGQVVGGKKVLVLGSLILCLAIPLFLLLSADPRGGAWWWLIPGLVLAGVGSAMINPVLAEIAMSGFDHRQAGMASGINNVFRQVGMACGIVFLGAMLSTQFNASLHEKLAAVSVPAQTTAAATTIRDGIESQVKAAGIFAASTGFAHGEESAKASREQPLFPQIQEAVAGSFIAGLRTVLYAAAGLVVLGLASALFLVRRVRPEGSS